MSHLILRVLVALLTFAIGLGAAKLVAYRLPTRQSIKFEVDKALEPKPISQSITFSGGEFVTAFQPHYFSSDGAHLRYGCFEYASSSDVARGLREEIIGKHIIEREPKLNDIGERIGERVVLADSLGSEKEAKIVWTVGSRLFLLRAPSLKYALLFEQSQVWAGDGYCVNVGELRRDLDAAARPNKSFERTAR